MRSVDAMTGEAFAAWPIDDRDAVDHLFVQARQAQALWRARAIVERAEFLAQLAIRLRDDVEPLAALMTREMGKPIAQARGEVLKCVGLIEHFSAHGASYLTAQSVEVGRDGARVVFEPLGVVLAIMPWNFPYWQVVRCAIPALLAGNAVVIKHAPRTQACAERLHAHMVAAGIPQACCPVVRVEDSDVASLIARPDVAAVALTGSTRAGRAVAKVAGAHLKPCVLELGGSDPLLVFADAEVEVAAAAAVRGRFQNSGQSCIASKRFVLHRDIAEDFMTLFVEACSRLVVGDPNDEATDIGPLAREELAVELQRQVDESVRLGARVVCGGRRRGAFMEPTVLMDVPDGSPAAEEELFGPVVSVWVEEDDDAMIARANATTFGLAASVWTQEARGLAFADRLECGAVAINQLSASDARLPFGGVKDSGMGRELGREGALAFVNVKTLRWTRDDTREESDA